jgi:hypothetical protein
MNQVPSKSHDVSLIEHARGTRWKQTNRRFEIMFRNNTMMEVDPIFCKR